MSAVRTNRTDESRLAIAQRTEIHVGMTDEVLGALAARSVYPTSPQRPGGVYESVVLNTNGGTAR